MRDDAKTIPRGGQKLLWMKGGLGCCLLPDLYQGQHVCLLEIVKHTLFSGGHRASHPTRRSQHCNNMPPWERSGVFGTDSILKITHKASFHVENMLRRDERANGGCEYLTRLEKPVKASPFRLLMASRFRHAEYRSEKCPTKCQSCEKIAKKMKGHAPRK